MNLDIDEFRYSFFRTSITNLFRDLTPSKIGLFDHMLFRYFQASGARRSVFRQPAAACPKWHRRGGVRRHGS